MKKQVLLLLLLIATTFGFAQVEDDYSEEELIEILQNLDESQKDTLEMVINRWQEFLQGQQVKTIGGVEFGISREEAERKLRNKFGEPEFDRKQAMYSYKHVQYAGHDFDKAYFMFQSDGDNTFLNRCIFLNNAKTKSDVDDLLTSLKDDLEKKYVVSEDKDKNGFPFYWGGISPLWNGDVFSFSRDYYMGWVIDVIEYEPGTILDYGYRYAVRLIYGPYEFVHEEL